MYWPLWSPVPFHHRSTFLFSYLNFVQTNGNLQRSQQVAQGKQDAMGQQSVLIEDNLYEVTTSIPTQKATHMKDIAHHAQRAIVRQGFTARQACGVGLLLPLRSRSVEPLMSPDNYIVGQSGRQSVFCCVWCCPTPDGPL